MSMLDGIEEPRPSKVRSYVIMALAFIIVGGGSLWYVLRFHTEKTTVHYFMKAVVAGDMEQARTIWKPSSGYTMKDFLEDWGPDGYYGPIKSFNVKDTNHPVGASGVIVIVEVSPYQPFPDKDDSLKQSKTKEINLWVQFKDESISFPPE